MMYSKKITVVEVVSSRFRELWKEWDFRLAVLLSLLIQFLLIVLCRPRKHDPRPWVRFVVWSVYSSADSVATFALGVLCSNLSNIKYNDDHPPPNRDAKEAELYGFWAPFLLLHLGGQDTITAFSLEDNELWLRHFLGLIVQSAIAFYAILMSWTGSLLSFLSILMFLAGIVKYGERTWVLRSASSDNFRRQQAGAIRTPDETLLSATYKEGPVANELIRAAYEKGRTVGKVTFLEFQPPVDNHQISEKDMHFVGHSFLQAITKRLIFDITFSSTERDMCKFIFRYLSWKDAFELIEIELGLVFDLLYTKAPLLYTVWGSALRFFIFSATCCSLLLFTCLHYYRKNYFSKVDVWITFVLLVAAVLVDIYSTLFLLASDGFASWLSRHDNVSALEALSPLNRLLRRTRIINHNKWSNKTSQLSILSLSKSNSLPCHQLIEFIGIEHYLHTTYQQVSEELKELIFRFLKEPSEYRSSFQVVPADSQGQGDDNVNARAAELFERAPMLEEQLWKSILFWHVVTEVVYTRDGVAEGCRSQFDAVSGHCKLIQQISRYMFCLLVTYPSMLSVGDQTSLEYMIDEVRRIPNFEDCGPKLELLFLGPPRRTSEGTASSSFQTRFYDTPRRRTSAASSLDPTPEGMAFTSFTTMEPLAKKWNKLGCTWLEIMTYAANKCPGREHPQQLSHGGELLSHVSLLMAHLGLTHHFQAGNSL